MLEIRSGDKFTVHAIQTVITEIQVYVLTAIKYCRLVYVTLSREPIESRYIDNI